MTYEINPVFMGNVEMGKISETLNAVAAEGWEPYAVDRSYHYFRREKVYYEKADALIQKVYTPIGEPQVSKKMETAKKKK